MFLLNAFCLILIQEVYRMKTRGFGIEIGTEMGVKSGVNWGQKRPETPDFGKKADFEVLETSRFGPQKVLFIFMRIFLENQNPSKSLLKCNSSCERNLRGDCGQDPPC